MMRSGLSGRFLEARAHVGPRLRSRIRERLAVRSFVLADWSSCGGPWRSVARELAVALSPTPGSESRNAWLARPRPATSCHHIRPTRLRALDGVPSGVAVCADRPEPPLSAPCGSGFTIKSGSDFQIGPSVQAIALIGVDSTPRSARGPRRRDRSGAECRS